MTNELVFDIGANNGDDTAEYLKHGCRVVAVEANPTLCKDLRDRFAREIESGQMVLVDKAISPRRTVTLYLNSAAHGWGTILPSYAEHGARLRGTVTPIDVETVTLIDLFRQHGIPDRMTMDIEGADIEAIASMMGSELPRHLSIERPKSFLDQMLVLAMLRRLGYARFAFVDQMAGSENVHSTMGLFDLPDRDWKGFGNAGLINIWLYALRALSAAVRRTPGMRSVAPRARWFDIHAVHSPVSAGRGARPSQSGAGAHGRPSARAAGESPSACQEADSS
jgi:FkbM family methyltransferase